MNRNEIYEELKMSYEELQQYLIRKYGGAVCDYFATPECKSKSKKVSRTSEGLYCHHMDEDKGGNLGNAEHARMQPFEWQKKERLVYCNILEHLILHMKIAVIRQKEKLQKPKNVPEFFTTGGIFMLCEEINDLFAKDGTAVAWKKRCFEEIKDNYEDYIILIKALLSYIDDNYCGMKDEAAFLVPGSVVYLADAECEILRVSKKRDVFLLQLPTGEEKAFKSYIASNQFTYVDQIDFVTRRMASGFEDFYESIYADFVNCEERELITSYVEALKVDYTGHGYAQYADVKLEDGFGAKNADEYISKALPMHCELTYDLTGKQIGFWSGEDIPSEAMDSFFIVRLETMFTVKDGVTPFIRYRERDFLRKKIAFDMSADHNFRDSGWTVLSTSDVYDKGTDKYYPKYIDKNGDLVDAVVILTLGKDDYLLFKETHDIRHLKVLDGCYFY